MSCFYERLSGLLLAVLLLGGCQEGLMDDLLPSGRDLRAQTSEAYLPGQSLESATRQAPLLDENGQAHTLDEWLDPADPPAAVVLYFTMWCPTCLAHTDHLYNQVLPRFQGARVVYLLVDYVSGDWADMRRSAEVNGYLGTELGLVLDADGRLFGDLHGAMGNVVVVDGQGVIRLNAYYQDGRALETVLSQLTGLP